MPREPRATADSWSPFAVLVEIAGPPPGSGLLYVFTPGWDPEWWAVAANDDRLGP